MLKTGQSHTIPLLWPGVFCLCLFMMPLPHVWAQQDDPVMGLVPAESLVCLRINNLDGALLKTDEFLAGVSPMGLSMLAKMGLGSLLGNPMLAGMDTSGSLALFVTADAAQGPMPVIAGLIPVRDFKQFVGGNPNAGELDADGLAQLSGQGTPSLLTCSVGQYALIGLAENREGFLAIKKKVSAQSASLAGLVDATQAQQAQQMPLWIFCNIQEINRAFGPMIQMQLQQVKAMVPQMAAQGQIPGGQDPGKLVDMYVSVLDTLLKETLSVTVGLKPSADALLLSKSIQAKPGSGLAKIFPRTSGKDFDPTLLNHLLDGAAVNLAICQSIPAWFEMNATMIDWLAAGLGEAMPKQNVEKVKAMMADAAAAIGQSGVFSLMIDQTAKPPMQMQYVLEVRDAAKLSALIDRSTEMFNTIWGEFYKAMGVEVNFDLKRAIAEHKGVSIDSASLTLQVNDQNTPQANLISGMYGDGFQYRWAMTDKHVLSAIGSKADAHVKQMIDKTLAPRDASVPTEMKAALAQLPRANGANMIMTLNVLRFWDMIKTMAPVPLPDIPVKTSSNIVIATYTDTSRFGIDLVLPKAHVIEIRDVVQAIAAQNMQ